MLCSRVKLYLDYVPGVQRKKKERKKTIKEPGAHDKRVLTKALPGESSWRSDVIG